VTKISRIKLRGSSEEEYVENLRRMLLAMAKDLRVILVKLADRLHNMQTLEFLPKEKQSKNAKETLEVYAPLAERLGMGEMKGQLEDLAFPYVFPQDYQWIVNYSKPHYKKTEDFLKKATRVIYKELAEEGIRAKVTSRPKHLYSLWRKLLRPEINKDIARVYDLVAMRILVESIRDCYGALGILHSLWKPVPNQGISDFIAQPKPNGYRSLHTKVFSLNQRILEVQIRTFEMHEEAENGIAAHWYYSSAKSKGVSGEKLEKGIFAPDDKLSWVKQLVSWQKEVVDSQEFMEALKFDALAHRIFVFSPQGDVYDLPEKATPVDFAYAVHSGLGNEVKGARVDGKMVTLDFKLKSGDMVEIIKKEGGKPSGKWLRFVVTSQARREISKYARSEI
jgi:GTP pyrophosphokinase